MKITSEKTLAFIKKLRKMIVDNITNNIWMIKILKKVFKV